MKAVLAVVFSLAALLASAPANAHDPALHSAPKAGTPSKLDCQAVERMDHTKIDPKDPVMQAIHKKCAANTDKHERSPAAPVTAPDAPSAPAAKSDHGGH